MYVDITGVYFKDVAIKKDESQEINKNRSIVYLLRDLQVKLSFLLCSKLKELDEYATNGSYAGDLKISVEERYWETIFVSKLDNDNFKVRNLKY